MNSFATSKVGIFQIASKKPLRHGYSSTPAVSNIDRPCIPNATAEDSIFTPNATDTHTNIIEASKLLRSVVKKQDRRMQQSESGQ